MACLIFLLFFLLSNFGSYFQIRTIIGSIVWCDKGGKFNRVMKLKQAQSFTKRFRMNYLIEHTNVHQKNLKFWLCIKSFFEIGQGLLLVVGTVCCLLDTYVSHLIVNVIFVESLLVMLILVCQSGINRNTKYDRIRMNRKNKRHN